MSNPTRAEELTLKVLDDDVTLAELEELQGLLRDDPAAEAVHLALMTQEAVLLGERAESSLADVGLAERTVRALKEQRGERVERAVLDQLEPRRAVRELEPAWRGLGGRRFWGAVGVVAAIALLVVGVRTYRVVSIKADPQEAFVYGRTMVTPGAATAYRVFVRRGDHATPVVGAAVYAVLRRVGHTGRVWTRRVRTDAHGLARLSPRVPADAAEGAYVLEVKVQSPHGRSTVRRRVSVKRSFRVLVSTDKPLYQPGQKIRVRTLALANADLKPVAGRPITIAVTDAKGNKVLSRRLSTSAYGIASAELRLAQQVNLGRYKVSAQMGDTRSSRAVEVKRYRLPRYRIELTTKKGYYGPGELLRGELQARYTFGKPVAGARVKLVAAEFLHAMRPFADLSGVTDAEGRFTFQLPLKEHFAGKPRLRGDAMAHLTATVTDRTGSTLKKAHDVTITEQPIRVALFPESGLLVPGVKNTLYVVTAYPDGRPAQTTVTLSGMLRQVVKTSAAGVAKLTYTPPRTNYGLPPSSVRLTAVDPRGTRVVVNRSLHRDIQQEAVLLRTDRALYRVGQPARITVLSAGRRGRVFLDVVKDRRTVAVKGLDLRDGKGELVLDLPPDLFGTLELHAYRILSDGQITGDNKVIQVSRASGLKITAALDKKTYRPGEKSLLKLAVSDATGKPVQAALSVAGVDEAVFALSELRPGLARVYFMLQEELLRPRYEIHQRLPMLPSQTARRELQGGTSSREAGLALFASTAGGATPKQRASFTWRQKKAQVGAQREAFFAGQVGNLLWLLVLLFLALVVPLVVYTGWRLVRRAPLDHVDHEDREGLIRAGKRLVLWWGLGLYLPASVLVLAGVLNPKIEWPLSPEGALVVMLGVLMVGLVFGSLVRWVQRLRANPASGAVPLLCKLLTPLPAAYLLGIATVLGLPLVLQGFPDHRATAFDALMTLFLTSVLLYCVLAGGLAATLRGLRPETTTGQRLRTAVGRFALVALLPVLLSMSMLTSGRKAAEKEDTMAAGAVQQRDSLEGVNGIGDRTGIFRTGVAKGKGARHRGKPRDRGLKSPRRVRRFFPETLLWLPEVITDAQGKATLTVPLADSITSWRLSLSGVDRSGRLGSATQGIRVFQDFFVDLYFPVALTQNDRVQVPAAVFNYLDKPQTVELTLQPKPWFRLHGPAVVKLTIGPRQVKRAHFTLTALKPGHHAVVLRARSTELADAVERKVHVTPHGRKVVQSVSGRLDAQKSHTFTIPRNAVAGGSDLLLKIHPGTLSQVVEGLDNIFRMPHGCFEQTSSATYPNVLVLDYLRRAKKLKPALELKARRYISLGYQRLLSFEVTGGGFEWFGRAPAHQVLTAYGLMELTDMARVHNVDPTLLLRTRYWLFSKQRADGSWKPAQLGIAEGAINQQRGSVLRTTAYITWAMLEAAPKGPRDPRLTRALGYLKAQLAKEQDSYTLALAANAFVAGKHPFAPTVLRRLTQGARSNKQGQYWTSGSTGVTFSRGNVLNVETTALATYALLKSGHAPGLARRALTWLVAAKDDRGTWRSTQATILALRALLAAKAGGAPLKKPARIRVAVNGKSVQAITVPPDQGDVLRLVSLKHLLRPGPNRVTLVADVDAFAYQVVATHYVPWTRGPTQPPVQPPLSITVRYDTRRLRMSDPLTCRVALQYNRPGLANMVLVDLGIPPGFAVETRSFDDLRRKGVIERYTLTGRQITLYLRALRQSKPVSFAYQLRARHPVSVRTPRSNVYKYYEPKVRASAAPVKLTVTR